MNGAGRSIQPGRRKHRRPEAEERGRQAALAEAERDQMQAELTCISDSQSQFEMYTDKGGQHSTSGKKLKNSEMQEAPDCSTRGHRQTPLVPRGRN